MRKFIGPIIIAIIVLAVIFGGALVGLYTDWLWFKDLGYSQIFTTLLLTKIEMGLLFGFLFFAIIYSNLWYARKIAPAPSPMGLEQQLLDRLGRFAKRLIGIALFVGSIIVSAMVGLEAATHWEEWLKFLHATPFGVTDPVFHKDIGFYVFRLPFLGYFYHWLFFALAASTIAAAALHYADEALDVFGNRLQFAPKVKGHLGLLVAAMFFLKAWGYKLSMYDLLFEPGKLFDGAGYTAIHANLPAFWILLVAAIVGGVLVLANIYRRGLSLAVAGLILVVGLSITVGAAYPALLQTLSVSPNELDKEAPYISTAIAATRAAYGLTEVAARPYEAESQLTAAQVNENIPTIENIRLWDSGHLLDAYSQVQTLQQYYHFQDVDVDRYWFADKPGDEKRYRQVWLGPRELDQSKLPENSQTWVNQHLQYTHGYGFCMSPVNEVSVDGMPVFFAKDIPVKTNVDLPIRRPGVYFGEMTNSYALVKTNAQEFDYPAGATTKPTSYEGSGGVRVGGFWRRLLFALRFSDVNILLNSDIKPESRVLYTRNIRERIETLLPFLTFDHDPYLVTVYGRLYWMRDGYTTSDAYPYSQHYGDDGFNYIRNSVKVVVDAYTGQVSVYTIEQPLKDPMIETYAKIFPGIFKSLSAMPSELRAHLRYPEDLFRVQTNIYKRYHMIDPVVYYNDSDRWDIPARADLLKTGGGDEQMEPYYIIMKLPNGESEEFILMTPYIRAGKQNMVAWICAKCDPADYGRLVLYQFPKKQINGPQQVAALANQNPTISQQITLWSTQGTGSSVSSGNLLVIPIENSLMYVMPVYLEATSTKIPEVKQVIVALGDNVAMAPTLNEAIAQVVGAPVQSAQLMGAPAALPAGKSAKGRAPNAPTAVGGADVARLVNQAASEYQKAEAAQRGGDWAAYGKHIDALKQTIKELQAKAK